jgi:hypothetical protein
MIPVIVHGKGFQGILRYAIGKPGAYLIGPVQGDVDELSAHFGKIRGRNQRCKKPVFHMALAIHPSEHLTDRQWEEIARKMMKRLGYHRNHYVVIRHTDEPQDHIHIVASRIRSDNFKVTDTYQEKWRASSFAAELEVEYNLKRAALDVFYEQERLHRTAPKRGEVAMRKERGVLSAKTLLRQRIDAAMADHPSVTEFLARLERFGVGVQPNIGGNHVSGIAFELNGFVIKGSKLGRTYTWSKLITKMDFDPARDLIALRNAKSNLGLDPEQIDPLAAQELQAHIIKTGLASVGKNSKLKKAANRVFTHLPDGGLTQNKTSDLLEVLSILGRHAKKIESNPIHSQNQQDDEDDPKKEQRKIS